MEKTLSQIDGEAKTKWKGRPRLDNEILAITALNGQGSNYKHLITDDMLTDRLPSRSGSSLLRFSLY